MWWDGDVSFQKYNNDKKQNHRTFPNVSIIGIFFRQGIATFFDQWPRKWHKVCKVVLGFARQYSSIVHPLIVVTMGSVIASATQSDLF